MEYQIGGIDDDVSITVRVGDSVVVTINGEERTLDTFEPGEYKIRVEKILTGRGEHSGNPPIIFPILIRVEVLAKGDA